MSNPIKAKMMTHDWTGDKYIRFREDEKTYIGDLAPSPKYSEKLVELINNWNPAAPPFDPAKVERLIEVTESMCDWAYMAPVNKITKIKELIVDLRGESK